MRCIVETPPVECLLAQALQDFFLTPSLKLLRCHPRKETSPSVRNDRITSDQLYLVVPLTALIQPARPFIAAFCPVMSSIRAGTTLAMFFNHSHSWTSDCCPVQKPGMLRELRDQLTTGISSAARSCCHACLLLDRELQPI